MSAGLVLILLAPLGVTAAPSLALGVTATAQQPVATQLAGRVPATAVAAVSALADSAARRGLPVEPLVEKAIEGGAKAAAPERIVAAVQVVLARLGHAQGALQAAGVGTPAPDAIEAGGFALSAGLKDGSRRGVRDAVFSRRGAAGRRDALRPRRLARGDGGAGSPDAALRREGARLARVAGPVAGGDGAGRDAGASGGGACPRCRRTSGRPRAGPRSAARAADLAPPLRLVPS